MRVIKVKVKIKVIVLEEAKPFQPGGTGHAYLGLMLRLQNLSCFIVLVDI